MELEEVVRLKRERNAVVLAHNYQRPEVQAAADFVGETLALAIEANNVEDEAIVFCGPDFMVEIASILNPDKIVVYANSTAKCPLASMCSAKDIETLQEMHPEAPVVGYMNMSIECRTKVDICCGSRNCVAIVRSLDSEEVILIPDDNLAAYVQRYVPKKKVISWPGFCVVHERIKSSDINELMKLHPKAEVLVHPECTPEVIDLATSVLSTDGMVEHVSSSLSDEFIIATESNIIRRLTAAAKHKQFYTIPKATCSTQSRITLADVGRALETLEPRVHLSEKMILEARRPLERMLGFDLQSEFKNSS